MDRASFEDIRDRLEAILAPVKFRLGAEVYDYASFGSMYAVWSRRGEDIRLLWDGKEGYLLLEARTDGEWRLLAEPLVHTPDAVEQLLSTARAHVE